MNCLTRGVTAAVCITSLLFTANAAQAVTLTEQTLVPVRLLQDLKSGRERKGDRVPLVVSENVLGSNQDILVPRGTLVFGAVTRSSGRGMFGKPGKIEFTIDYIQISDSLRVPLQSTPTAARGRNNSAAAITTAVFLAPIAVFVKGREVTIEQGREFTVYVDQTTELPESAPPAAVAEPKVAPKGESPADGTVTLVRAEAAPPTPKTNAEGVMVFKLHSGDKMVGQIISFNFSEHTYVVRTAVGDLAIAQSQIASITPKE